MIDRLVQRYVAKKHNVSSLSDGGFTGNGLRGIFGKMRGIFLNVFRQFCKFFLKMWPGPYYKTVMPRELKRMLLLDKRTSRTCFVLLPWFCCFSPHWQRIVN